MANKTALIVSAHSADFVWRCGGAIALHAAKGYEVTVVCLSYGERGESAKLWKKDGMTLEKVKTERRKEAENAAKALDVHDIQFFDLGDYPLEMDRAAKDRLVDVIRKVQPSFMMTHSQWDPYNTDHMYVSQWTLECRADRAGLGSQSGRKGPRRAAGLSVRAAPDRADGLEARTSFSTSPRSGTRSGPPSSAWRARSTFGPITRTSRKTAPTTSSAIQAASRAGAPPNMPRAFSRSSRAPWMNSDGRRRSKYRAGRSRRHRRPCRMRGGDGA